MLRVEGPLGGFVLDEEAKRPMLFVAGGTGFAPIKGMLRHAFRTGIKRPMHLFWGARREIDLYENDVVAEWARERSMFRYTPALSEAGESEWDGEHGWVHEGVAQRVPGPVGTSGLYERATTDDRGRPARLRRRRSARRPTALRLFRVRRRPQLSV